MRTATNLRTPPWVIAWITTLSVMLGGAARAQVTHPLDPLSADEMREAVRILKESGQQPEGARFAVLARREPPKDEVYRWKPGQPLRRDAFAVMFERRRGRTFEALVDLQKKRVLSIKEMPGVQPLLLTEEATEAMELVRRDPRWQEAMKKRGITDLATVALEPWGVGTVPESAKAGGRRPGRMMRVMSFLIGKSQNRYARPIEGVVALVDLPERKVLELSDTGVVPLPPETGDYDAAQVPQRAAPKPLRITQPEGPTFQISGQEVRWQGWRLRVSVHPREGLVLHTVGYEDSAQKPPRVRPILYRASLSEMFVPYGDPDPNWRWRAAFDVGEYGIGLVTCSLQPGIDVPENTTFLDAVLPRDDGAPKLLPRAIAIYERDAGVLWRHWDYVSDRTHGRRARELAVSYMTAVGNYDYMMTWVFRQDGSLSLEADLIGIMFANDVAAAREPAEGHGDPYSHLVAPHVSAVHHQHFFLFRLDLDVDGTGNSVYEMNSRGLPMGVGNPSGNAFTMELSPLRGEEEARRQVNLSSSRRWLVQNPEQKNRLGAPTGFLLLPGENAVPFADPASSHRQRGAFINHHLWVTRFAPHELYAAGDYPNQNDKPDGLPVYTADNQPLNGKDLVLWYTLGVTHIPRPEEWPIMSKHHTGFTLAPAGFFGKNPALDVPPPPPDKASDKATPAGGR